MTIRPVFFNGMIQNTQDVSAMQHNENHRPAVEQSNIQIQEQKKEESLSQEVHSKEDVEQQQHFDAREKGSNEYSDNRKKKKKEERAVLPDGSVRMKMSKGFDIKI